MPLQRIKELEERIEAQKRQIKELEEKVKQMHVLGPVLLPERLKERRTSNPPGRHWKLAGSGQSGQKQVSGRSGSGPGAWGLGRLLCHCPAVRPLVSHDLSFPAAARCARLPDSRLRHLLCPGRVLFLVPNTMASRFRRLACWHGFSLGPHSLGPGADCPALFLDPGR